MTCARHWHLWENQAIRPAEIGARSRLLEKSTDFLVAINSTFYGANQRDERRDQNDD